MPTDPLREQLAALEGVVKQSIGSSDSLPEDLVDRLERLLRHIKREERRRERVQKIKQLMEDGVARGKEAGYLRYGNRAHPVVVLCIDESEELVKIQPETGGAFWVDPDNLEVPDTATTE